MIMNKQILYTLLTLFTFFSCTNDITESEAGVGSVTFSVTNAEDEVVIETRALSDIEEEELKVTLVRGENYLFKDNRYGDIMGKTFTYSAASDYFITAANCTETEAESTNGGWGQDRVYGEKSFAIIANENNTVDVTCSLANSGVAVSFSGYVKNKYPNCSVKLYAADDENRSFTFNQNIYRRAFFNGTKAMQYIVTLTDGGEEHSDTFSLEPGHYYNVTVKMQNEESASPQITIGISVDGNLVGEQTFSETINPYK